MAPDENRVVSVLVGVLLDFPNLFSSTPPVIRLRVYVTTDLSNSLFSTCLCMCAPLRFREFCFVGFIFAYGDPLHINQLSSESRIFLLHVQFDHSCCWILPAWIPVNYISLSILYRETSCLFFTCLASLVHYARILTKNWIKRISQKLVLKHPVPAHRRVNG